MKRLHIGTFAALTAAAACGLLLTGCEVESASNPVVISPTTATIALGESIQFTASGGYAYQWSLENDTWGTLSSTTGDSVIYTSLYSPNEGNDDTNGLPAAIEADVQVLRVTSIITESQPSGGSGTNANSQYAVSEEAFITHL